MSSTSDNPEAPPYHELPDVKAWAEAVRASTHRVRVDAFENHNYALHWFSWLTFGLGWTYEKAWKWIDDNHGEELLGVKTGLLFHESPLWYILYLFVDPEIRRECPRGCHARLMGEIQSAIEMMERRGQERLYQEEFWRKVQSCVTEVTARWRSVGWSIDKINQLHDEKKNKSPHQLPDGLRPRHLRRLTVGGTATSGNSHRSDFSGHAPVSRPGKIYTSTQERKVSIMKTRRTILAVMGLTCLALSLIFFTGGFDWITRTAQKFATDRRAMQLAVEHISTNYGSKTASASWPRHRNNQIFVLVTFLPRTPGGDAIVIIDDKATQVLQVIPGY